jgi:uncharacterized protein (DUF488 family)
VNAVPGPVPYGGGAAILYTIGYEGAAQASLLEALLYNDVQTLLDIRELPQSRKPGFSKTALAAALTGCGIRYEHIRALGTPRDIRHRHRIDHDHAAFRQGYLEHLATQGEALAALVELAPRERCCLLCYEADPRECHRSFVAERAAEMSGGAVQIAHLSI